MASIVRKIRRTRVRLEDKGNWHEAGSMHPHWVRWRKRTKPLPKAPEKF